MASLTTEEIQEILTAADYQVLSLDPVFEGSLYIATLQSVGNQPKDVYLKVYSKQKYNNIKEVLHNGVDIGLPTSTVLQGEETVLVSDIAPGTQLSYILPVISLPGIWFGYGQRMEAAYSRLGEYLGNYHQSTRRGEVTIAGDTWDTYLNHAVDELDILDESTVETIRTAFEQMQTHPLPNALHHGDMSPHNVLYSKETVTLLDFHFREEVCLHDRVLTEIGVELMFKRLPHGRQSQYRRLVSAFEYGYFNSRPDAVSDERIYSTMKVAMALKVLYHYASVKKFQEHFTKAIDTRLIQSIVEDCLESPGLYTDE